RAKPAIRLGESRVAAARLQVIDAHIAGDAGTHGKFALDAATRRHGGFIGEEHRADLAIFVGPARFAQQSAVLPPPAKFLRRHKAAFPKPPTIAFRGGLVFLESASRIGLEIQRKTLTNKKLVQAGRFTLN